MLQSSMKYSNSDAENNYYFTEESRDYPAVFSVSTGSRTSYVNM